MADAAERRVYFSISKSENSHADNTYEDILHRWIRLKSTPFWVATATDFVCGFKWKREWMTSYQTSFTVDVVGFPFFVQMNCSTADKMSSMTRLLTPTPKNESVDDWLLRISLQNTFFPFAEKWACVVTSTEGMQCRQCWGDIWNQFLCMRLYI